MSAGPVYRVRVSPGNHSFVVFFATLPEGRITSSAAPAPGDPEKVLGIFGPDFARLPRKPQDVLNKTKTEWPQFNDGNGGLRGANLYAELVPYPLLKACFPNIFAKSGATELRDGGSCL